LIPVTGGVFQVHLTRIPQSRDGDHESTETEEVLLWDRKAEGGFPETKILKQRLRNYIEPGRDLGHSDKPSTVKKDAEPKDESVTKSEGDATNADKQECEDCT